LTLAPDNYEILTVYAFCSLVCMNVVIGKIIDTSNLLYMGDCHAMAQAITGRSVTEEIWVRYQASSLGICGGQSCTERGFFFPPRTSLLPV